VLVVLAGGVFFWRLGERDLWSSHEARAAMNARSLLEPDSPGLPRLFDGRLELQKPPLYYWLCAGIAWLDGGEVDGLAVRLPAALAGLATVLVIAGGLMAQGRPVAGLVAGLVLASSAHFPWLARIGRIDMPLALTVTLAAGGFAWALGGDRPHRGWALVAAWLAVAEGVLLKGPIGLVLPAAIIAGWLLVEGRWPAFWEGRAWRQLLAETAAVWGLGLVALVCVPVFVWLEQSSGGRFFREFIWLHNVERGLGGARLRSHPWWLYGPYLGLYLLPFSPLLVAGLWPRLWWNDRLARLGLAWTVAVVLVLSAARFKRADYLAPAYPGAALFLGCLVDRWHARRWLLAVVAGLGAVMLAGWWVRIEWGLPAEEPYRDYRAFAGLVRRHAPIPEEVVFFRTEAHALAFRMGRPVVVLVEWHELQLRLQRPGAHHVVLPPAVAMEASCRLPGTRLEEVGRNTTLAGGRHERPLVLMRAWSVPPQSSASHHAGLSNPGADRR
jgi:4-amino-4-deoxy-L-arabinose transferase-like glycosyltransferase